MPDEPIVLLRLPLYSLLGNNNRLLIGAGKAMLWTSVPRVKAFMELVKNQCDNFLVIDNRDGLRRS